MRIGVYVCHCGLNIASILDVEALKEFAEKLPDVAVTSNLAILHRTDYHALAAAFSFKLNGGMLDTGKLL